MSRKKTPDEFWSQVAPPTAKRCREWQGARTRDGHGLVSWHGRRTTAHRIAMEIITGSPVPPDMYVCHHCDNPPCCNPEHLYIGSPQQNVQDCVDRGRLTRPKGTTSPYSRFTMQDVRQIRARAALGETHRAIAADFGVSRPCVSQIVRGERYLEVSA